MKDSEISDYLNYWMDGDSNFSAILGDPANRVEDVEYLESNGLPRAVLYMDKNLFLLFPPFEIGFDYSQIDYK